MKEQKVFEKIIEYIDGELPSSEEENLFLMLSQSEELRIEMREQLRILRLVSSDKASLLPPSSSTLNILSTIGFVQEPFKTGFNRKVLDRNETFWRKIRLPFVVAILSSLFTLLVLNFPLMVNKGNSIQTSSQPVIVQTPPMIISTIETSTGIKKKLSKKSNLSFNSDTKGNNGFLNSFSFPVFISNIGQNNIGQLNKEITPIKTIDYNLYNFESTQSKSFSSDEIDISEEKGKYTLVFRGIQGITYPNPDINSNDKPLFSNFGIGLYFLKFSDVQFGVEFGKEIFGQRFINTVDNVDFFYEQKPILYWGAVGAKYYISNKFWDVEGLNPTVTFLAGGTQVGGPLIKLSLGLNWVSKSTNFGMFLGFESSILAYQNQKRFYLSKKFGLTYGILYNF